MKVQQNDTNLAFSVTLLFQSLNIQIYNFVSSNFIDETLKMSQVDFT